jgi:hypothetical protein
LFYNSLPTSEANICRGEIVDAIVVSLVIVMIDEGADLYFHVCREVAILQKDAVFSESGASARFYHVFADDMALP